MGRPPALEATRGGWAGPPPDLLDRFVRLVGATDEDIFRIARRFGVLTVEAFRNYGVYSEATDDWRKLASQARAALLIASRLYGDASGDADD